LAVGYLAVLRFKHVEESAENMIEDMNNDSWWYLSTSAVYRGWDTLGVGRKPWPLKARF